MSSLPREETVNSKNRDFIEYFNKRLGRTPNLLVAMMHSANALSAYYPFHSRKTSLSRKEIEAITLTVSQHNGAMYCLSAHTMIAKLNGFSDEEILELRKGSASFNPKLDAMVKLAGYLATHCGSVNNTLLDNFFAAGFTREDFMDVVQTIGDTFIANMTGRVFQVPIDYPLAKEL
ncbi:carboxymuconolactone decarboxylase family protein [uncultured Chitinophaga sp.]|uniref:carboxymuconolactone decarboxylase family protein n=1 Tax=uncultured Chitinophaga sp. TaxID=339340 RepID=UPI002635B5DA|nr:carboxymuconolactone decarboxylase family protein [uncultured Chitinophaga sp.]